MLSAREAQRLTKTRWQAELTKLEKLVKKAICGNLYQIKYVGTYRPIVSTLFYERFFRST